MALFTQSDPDLVCVVLVSPAEAFLQRYLSVTGTMDPSEAKRRALPASAQTKCDLPVKHYLVDSRESAWTDGLVQGLGDALAEARILDRPLSSWRAGFEEAPDTICGPALVLGRDLWPSEGLGEALRAQATATGLSRLARDPQGPGLFCDPLARLPRDEEGRILFDCWYVPDGVSVPREGLDERSASPIDLDGRIHTISLPMDPELLGRENLDIVVGAQACVPVSHWAELLRANIVAIGTRVLAPSPWAAAFQLLWAAVRAMSLNPFRVLQRLTIVGRGCTIHPSAVVEGCTLGDNVQIDAHAVLRGCHVGDNVRIGAHTVADFSIFGANSRLTRMAAANLCVVYPGASVGGALQLAVVGRKSTTKLYSVGTDMRLGGAVKVSTPRGLLSVDIGYQGICLGHNTFVGSGVWIAPGREIAAGRQLLREPELMVLK